jgi:SAM-dependent methyltransferase
MSSYEPGKGEIFLTLLAGVIFSPLYRDYVNRLELKGKEWVLDFGSGSGVCSKHLAGRLQQGCGYLACLDVSSSWNIVIRKTLKRYPNVEYLLGDIAALHIPDASFDAIMCHFVLDDYYSRRPSGGCQALDACSEEQRESFSPRTSGLSWHPCGRASVPDATAWIRRGSFLSGKTAIDGKDVRRHVSKTRWTVNSSSTRNKDG